MCRPRSRKHRQGFRRGCFEGAIHDQLKARRERPARLVAVLRGAKHAKRSTSRQVFVDEIPLCGLLNSCDASFLGGVPLSGLVAFWRHGVHVLNETRRFSEGWVTNGPGRPRVCLRPHRGLLRPHGVDRRGARVRATRATRATPRGLVKRQTA